jgi:hypothetical protein
MQELRFVAVSEDGRYAVLAVPGRSARFTLPIDERLRAVALGQTSRLAQYEIEVESPLRPKEIQARIRAGETVEEIADAAGIAVERVRWFEGPVLAERAYMADQAQASSVRRPGESTPGPRLGEITAKRLTAVGADPDDVQWDARKRGDGNWQVLLTFTTGGRLHVAEWMFDPRRRHVIPVDDNAARMSLPDVELPVAPEPSHGQATVTRLEPRVRHEAPAAASAHSGPGATVHSGPVQQPPMRVEPEPPVAVPYTQVPASSMKAPPTHPPAVAPAATVTPATVVTPAPAATASEPPAEPVPAIADPGTPEPAAAGPAAAEPAVVEPAAVGPAVVEPAAAVAAEPSAPVAEPAVTVQPAVTVHPGVTAEPVVTAEPDVAAQPAAIAQPGLAPAMAVTEPAVQEVAGKPADPAASAPAEPTVRSGRKAARGRRSSVPSWDEIMLGSSRQQD